MKNSSLKKDLTLRVNADCPLLNAGVSLIWFGLLNFTNDFLILRNQASWSWWVKDRLFLSCSWTEEDVCFLLTNFNGYGLLTLVAETLLYFKW